MYGTYGKRDPTQEALSPSMTKGQQLQRWQEATGRETPGFVPLSCTLEVGRFKFRTSKDKMPNVMKMLAGRHKRPQRRVTHPTLVVFGGRSSRGSGQEAAYNRAIRTGSWA